VLFEQRIEAGTGLADAQNELGVDEDDVVGVFVGGEDLSRKNGVCPYFQLM
jgi:hypothetical protein